MNTASSGIAGTIGLVGDVASSVARASGGVAGNAIGEFGSLVSRMTMSSGNKPTPLETYASMVTNHNAKGMTAA